jgi:hypothetical protein
MAVYAKQFEGNAARSPARQDKLRRKILRQPFDGMLDRFDLDDRLGEAAFGTVQRRRCQRMEGLILESWGSG